MPGLVHENTDDGLLVTHLWPIYWLPFELHLLLASRLSVTSPASEIASDGHPMPSSPRPVDADSESVLILKYLVDSGSLYMLSQLPT